MVKKIEIPDCTRNQVIGLWKGDQSLNHISKILQLPKSTVQYIIARWKKYGTTKNCSRTGRPRKVQPREMRCLKRTLRKNRWTSLRSITSEFNTTIQKKLSCKTVRRRIADLGFKSYVPAKKPLISERNRRKRLLFYNSYRQFSISDWSRVIWSDESRFNLFHSDGRERVWRCQNERYNQDCIRKTIQGNGGSVLIWACFYKTTLGPCFILDKTVNSTTYIDEVLTPFYARFYVPSLERGQQLLFQQDNAPSHTSKQTKRWMEQKQIQQLSWPPQSPDLNLIEHLWDVLQRQINSRSLLPKTLSELKVALVEEWRAIPGSILEKLVEGMPKRLEELRKARGLNTRY